MEVMRRSGSAVVHTAAICAGVRLLGFFDPGSHDGSLGGAIRSRSDF